jgi:soluble lytic murein transglycosylase-like protein
MKLYRHLAIMVLDLAIMVLATASALAAGPAQSRTVYDLTLKNGFTFHLIRHEAIGANTRAYLDDSNFIDVPSVDIAEIAESQVPVAPAPELAGGAKKVDLNDVIAAAGDKHRIDPDLISSVIHAESSFNPKAVSPKGAQGLMQLMPGTASRLGVTDAFDPYANVNAGTQYLRELLLRYNGDMAKALAAYNAGPLRVQQYKGVPPYRETRAYVAQVIREFNRKKLAARAQAPAKDPKIKIMTKAKPANGGVARNTEQASVAKPRDTNQNR